MDRAHYHRYFLSRLLSVAALLLAFPLLAEEAQPSFVPRGYEKIWGDEFDGDAVDSAKWTIRKYQYPQASYSPEAVRVGEGKLHLRSFERDGTIFSGTIQSKGLFERRYGYYECRVKFQRLQGHHGCFWLQSVLRGKETPEQLALGPAATGAEIDVLEFFGEGRKKDVVGINIYYPDPKGTIVRSKARADESFVLSLLPQSTSDKEAELCDDFHTVGLLWTEDACVFYLEGHEVMRETEVVSKVDQFIIVSLQCHEWERPRLDRSRLHEDEMLVDYVRVYAMPPSAS